MEYSITDKTINSFTVTTSYTYDDDVVVVCALCNDGYTFNYQTRECEYLAIVSPCER